MALTATATPRVQHDVVQQLCLTNCVVFRSSFNRSNLRWAVCCTVSQLECRALGQQPGLGQATMAYDYLQSMSI